MAQQDKIRFADGRVMRPGDWTTSPLYTVVEIDDAANLSPLDGFSYGLGGDVPGSLGPRQSTIVDTNMEGQGSILAENEELLIFGLCVELIQTTAASTTNFFTSQEAWCPDPPLVSATNCQRILRDTLVRMKIAATKDYLAVPIGFLPGTRGVDHVYGSARSTGSTWTEGVFVGYNGANYEGAQRLFATPHQVGPGEQFIVRLEFPFGTVSGLEFGLPDTSARIKARIYHRGLRRRPVA